MPPNSSSKAMDRMVMDRDWLMAMPRSKAMISIQLNPSSTKGARMAEMSQDVMLTKPAFRSAL